MPDAIKSIIKFYNNKTDSLHISALSVFLFRFFQFFRLFEAFRIFSAVGLCLPF